MSDRRVDTGIVYRNGSYRFTVSCGYDMHYRQIRKTTTWRPPTEMTEKKADKEAKKAYAEFQNRCAGLSTLNEHMRFSDLCEEYFKIYAPNELKPITAYTYKGQVKNHFLEHFGNKKLQDIKTGMITDYFNTYMINGKKLTPATAKKLYTIMQSIFTFAVHQRYLKDNPARNVILPKKDVFINDKRKFSAK